MVEVKLKMILKVIDFRSYESYFQKMDDFEIRADPVPLVHSPDIDSLNLFLLSDYSQWIIVINVSLLMYTRNFLVTQPPKLVKHPISVTILTYPDKTYSRT